MVLACPKFLWHTHWLTHLPKPLTSLGLHMPHVCQPGKCTGCQINEPHWSAEPVVSMLCGDDCNQLIAAAAQRGTAAVSAQAGRLVQAPTAVRLSYNWTGLLLHLQPHHAADDVAAVAAVGHPALAVAMLHIQQQHLLLMPQLH